MNSTGIASAEDRSRPARTILFAFLCTFLASRIMVLPIMLRRVPDFYLYLGGNHVHHLNYGIFLLTAVGAWSLLGSPVGKTIAESRLMRIEASSPQRADPWGGSFCFTASLSQGTRAAIKRIPSPRPCFSQNSQNVLGGEARVRGQPDR